MAVFSNIKLANPIVLTATPSVFYTCPANIATIVSSLSVANSSANTATFSIYFVPSGGSPGLSNVIIPSGSLPGFSLANFSLGQVMTAGDKIYAEASVANVLTLHGSGITQI